MKKTNNKNNNKNAHILNGNIINNKKNLKIVHWNKGPYHFHNKIDDMKILIYTHKPHILSLSEANWNIKSNINDLGLFDR